MITYSTDLESRLPDILDELRELQQFYSVWKQFTNGRNQAEYEPTMERYPVFFDSIVRAHFSALVIALYRIYDKAEGTLTLRQLYGEVSAILQADPSIRTKTEKLHGEIEATWKKVCILRSNVFGHRSAKLNPEAAFKKAGLSPDDLGEMIRRAQRLFNWISRAIANKTYAFNLSAAKDISKFMTRASKHGL